MTQFSDNLYLGAVRSQPTVSNPFNDGQGIGPLGRIYNYDIVPLTLQPNGLAAAQAVAAAGNLTLGGGTTTGITTYTDSSGNLVYQFDVPRCVTITSSGADTGKTMTVSGYDNLGQPQTETITGPGTATVTGKKAFRGVYRIAVSAATAGNISSGTSDTFGLPLAVQDAGYIIHTGWNETLADDAGTFVAADNTTPSPTTGDVRGTYKPSANASNGTRRLVVNIAATGIQAGPNATFAGAFGLTPA